MIKPPISPLGGNKVTGKHYAVDKATGQRKIIGGYAVFLVDEYKGWEIERHVGGFVARKNTKEGMEVETMAYPHLASVKRSIDAYQRDAQKKYGVS